MMGSRKDAEKSFSLKQWLSKPSNILLIAILVCSLIVRIYFLSQTTEQTLWWDEAEYGSTAKKWAFGVDYELNPQRPPLFQYMWSILLTLGSSESLIKFILVTIPSVGLVFCIFLLGKEMYNDRIALIAASLAAVSWTFLFWSNRFQPDFFSMCFQVLSIYYMWKYFKEPKNKFVILSALFAALGFYFKVSALLVPIILALFILIKDRSTAFKNKGYYIFAIVFLLALIPYFIWSQATFSTLTAFTKGYIQPVAESTPFGWYNLKFYYNLTTGVTFALFLLGVIYASKFLLYLDRIVKKKDLTLNPDLFSISVFLIVSAFYIFHIKNTDDRWVFLWLPFIFFMVGRAIEVLNEFLKQFGKQTALIICLGILLLSLYGQWSHGSSLIEFKKDSYSPVRESSLWIKDQQNPADVIITQSYTQATYYSERTIRNHDYFKNETALNSFLKNYPQNSGKIYVVMSVFEYHQEWFNAWFEENKEKLTPVKIYVSDPTSQQAVLIVYEAKPSDFQ